MAQHRQLFRVPLRRAGRVCSENTVADCLVIDITEQGLQVESSLQVEPGARLHVAFALSDTRTIQCIVTVLHAQYPRFGGLITEISDHDRHELSHFIEQILSLNLTGF